MKHFMRLSGQDARNYFGDTIATCNESGEDAMVSVDCDGGRVRYWLNDNCYTPGQFFEQFTICKFPLGWTNFKINRIPIAKYVTTNPGRRMCKGHRLPELNAISPYEQALQKVSDALVTRNMQTADAPRKLPEAITKRLQELDNYLHKIRTSMSLTHVQGSLSHPDYNTVEEALECFSGKPTKTGMALSRAFAVCINEAFHVHSAALYYHMKPIGFVDDTVHIHKSFEHIAPEFERVLGYQPTIEGDS